MNEYSGLGYPSKTLQMDSPGRGERGFPQLLNDIAHNYKSPGVYFFFEGYFVYLTCPLGATKNRPCVLVGSMFSRAIWRQDV